MSYDPADLKLPPWLTRLFDRLVAIRLPVGSRWTFGIMRPGVLLAGVLLGLWLAAFYSGNNLLYLCGAMLSAFAAVSIWQGVRLLRSVQPMGSFIPSHTVAGEPYVFRERLLNPLQSAAIVEMEWDAGVEQVLKMQLRFENGSLLNGFMRAPRRGLFELREASLTTSAPLGLWQIGHRRVDRIIWPVLPKPKPWAWSHVGGEAKRLPFEGDELHDLRGYVPGDALSRIHWRKAAADSSSWSVKRFQQQDAGEQNRVLRVDLRVPGEGAAEGIERFEELIGQAWFWIEARLEEKAPFEVILGQNRFELGGDAEGEQTEALLRALAASAPERLPPVGSGGSLLSLVTAG